MATHMPGANSYFPSSSDSYAYAATSYGDFRPQNIDDIVYRYSSELDRGTPTAGIYARDGLWDEDDTSRRPAARPPLASTSAVSRKDLVTKGRNRSGTVSTVINKEEKSGGMWSWTKKSSGSPVIDTHRSPEIARASHHEEEIKQVLRKEKSRSRLRGKGRRGELSVAVTGDPDESFESPPPIPSTPASYLTNPSPAFSSGSFLSPASYPSRVDLESEHSPPYLNMQSKGSKLSWKRGMEKIFRSKSSAGLREAFVNNENQRPPLPEVRSALHKLPQQTKNPLGKPFSSSTPPMPLRESRRENTFFYYGSDLLSPPPTAKSESFQLPSHPSLPHDPFVSSLDLSSNPLPSSSTPLSSPRLGSPLQSARPRLSKNSPSLRDFKSFLPRPSKPTLSKAKSMANIRDDKVPTSAPPDRTEFFPSITLSKRMSSMMGLSSRARADADDDKVAPTPMILPQLAPLSMQRPQFNRMPTESPPLLPPNPPYFPTSSSMFFRSPSASSTNIVGASDSSGSTSVVGGSNVSTQSVTTPLSTPSSPFISAPNLSLPPTPSSYSPQLGSTATMQRSASGAVLLPRSRSTSMSFKSPPTSSSFFDLYEQLGIWPTPEKAKPASTAPLAEVDTPSKEDTSIMIEPDLTDTSMQAQMHESPSASFSVSSWEAAISAFPMVEEASAASALDFGGPSFADVEVIETLDQSPMIDDAASDVFSMMAATSESHGQPEGQAASSRASTSEASGRGAQVAGTASRPLGGTVLLGMNRHTSGSAGSSRNSSRDRRRRSDRRKVHEEGGWFERGVSSGSSSDSDDLDDELDDVPLSQLHPEAAAAQREVQKRKAQRRADRGRMRSRAMNPRFEGRNPGAECNWDGEGGVPAEVLRKKLERLMSLASGRSHHPAVESVSLRPNQTEPIPPPRSVARPQPALRPQRSFTDPTNQAASIVNTNTKGKGVQRSQTGKRPGSSGRSQQAPIFSPALPYTSLQPSPVILQRPVSPAAYPSYRKHSLSATDHSSQCNPTRPGPSRHNSNATSSSQGHASSSHGHGLSSHGQALIPPVPSATSMIRTADVTRSNTTATQRSTSSRQHSRALSTAASTHRPNLDEYSHIRSTTEPVPSRERTALLVNAFLGALTGKRLVLEVFPETTARDVLSATHQRGDLAQLESGKAWVIVEIFAELGCERQLREYEPLQGIVRGWDPLAKFNCLMFKESNRAGPTLAKAIASPAPFLGSYVQYETKRGKWSKRWLATRGGQLFMAKNEKNKQEVQVNTSFHDVYTMTRPYGSPKPFVFVLKRIEASSYFEDPEDYTHMFSCEDSLGPSLVAAIYDAKSYTIAQTKPHLLPGGGGAVLSRKPTMKSYAGGPLVSLETEKEVERSAFTGKGLLRV